MKMTMLEAINKTIDEEMSQDSNVVVFGEDVGIFGGCFGVTAGLLDKYGEERVIDFPIAENTLVRGFRRYGSWRYESSLGVDVCRFR